ncbi:hypothetical protein D9619_010538 [Psilocybe cf. subviscida]|uniref:Uncharacterized protein n=1 Tax=Psilocybe cf. subviscida TaxID=2480587 RepID=A0A8H5ASH7_9AGAR|nr:hypothetical protein D9619_010538 [Psilocybe cf. subviscida]
MGGFILYENGYPVKVLDYVDLAELLQAKVIDPPTVTERDLQDRSKGDTTSKAIVVLQTMWFVLQCIARVPRRLPLSELEVVTLAFVVMNVAIYTVWWNKPQGVEMAICVPLKNTEKKSAEKDVDASSTPLTGDEVSHPETANLAQPERQHSNNTLPSIPRQCNQSTGHKQSWLRRMLRKDREEVKSTFLPVVILLRVVGSVFRPLAK